MMQKWNKRLSRNILIYHGAHMYRNHVKPCIYTEAKSAPNLIPTNPI